MAQLAIAATRMVCDRDVCHVSGKCDGTHGAECFVHASYIREASDILLSCSKDASNMAIASHMLMPLYTQLFKLQLYEMSLESPMMLGRVTAVNPVYREMRAVMKDITHMWRIVGLAGAAVTAPALSTPTGSYFDMLTAVAPSDPGTADVPIDTGTDGKVSRRQSLSKEVSDVIGIVQAFSEEVENNDTLHAIIEQGDLDISVTGDFDPTKLPAGAEQLPNEFTLTNRGTA